MFVYAGASGLSDFLALKLPQEGIYGRFTTVLSPGSRGTPQNGIYGSPISHKFLFLVR